MLFAQVADAQHRLALIWADAGYTGSLVEHCLDALALVVSIVERSDDQKGFVVLPKRWIVERFFAHLMQSRRLVRDFERRTTRAEAIVYWSMILLMSRRLAAKRRLSARVNWPGCRSASQPRATRCFAFDRSASTLAGTTSMPKAAAISWQVSGPWWRRCRSASACGTRW